MQVSQTITQAKACKRIAPAPTLKKEKKIKHENTTMCIVHSTLRDATTPYTAVSAHAKMKTIKPNYKDLEFADHMGPKLRNHLEKQLVVDLKHYKVDKDNLKFDWSDSCVEGQATAPI